MINVFLSVVSLAINGITYNLKGLRMYTDQLVCWHLINMGSPKDFQSVHFHGQTFIHKKITSYRQAVYPLLPGEQHNICCFCAFIMNRSLFGLTILQRCCKAENSYRWYLMSTTQQRQCVSTLPNCPCRELCYSGDVSIQTWPVAAGDGGRFQPTEGHADPLSGSR